MPQAARRASSARPTKTKPRVDPRLRNINKPKAGNTAIARRVAAVEQSIANAVAAQHVSTGPSIAIVSWLDAKARGILEADPVNDEMAVRPEGHVYMPHVFVRNRFDRAIGVGNYFILENGTPARQGDEIVQSWKMDVPGVGTIASATGRGRYHANNKAMTWGDAVEAAKSNAIMRLGKALSVGKILWAPQFQQKWREANCVVVECIVRNKTQCYVRRADADFLDGEKRVIGPANRENMRLVRRRMTDDVVDAEPARPPQSRSGQPATGQAAPPAAGSASTPSSALRQGTIQPPSNASTPQVFVKIEFVKEDTTSVPAYKLWRATTRYAAGQGRTATAEYAVFSSEFAKSIDELIKREQPCELAWKTSASTGNHKLTEINPLTSDAQ